MHCRMIARVVMTAAGLVLCTATAPLDGQSVDRGTALSAIGQAMFFRQSVLGDSLPFDACSVYERSGRPNPFVGGLLPGLRGLLDRPVDDPCSLPKPSAGGRTERLVRVDSVVIADSEARVHLHVRRGEWSHTEVYSLATRLDGGWGFREVRMTNPFHVTPPPPRLHSHQPQ